MAKFPSLPLFTDALVSDTYHLTPAEFGAYMRMLIAAWRSPGCRLPNDDKFLGKIIGDSRNWARIKPAIIGFWSVTDDGFLLQYRLLDEYDYVILKSVQASAAGKASALKRKNRDLTNVETQLRSRTNENPTPIPIPTPTVDTYVSTTRASDFDIFWKTYPRKVAKGAAEKAYASAIKHTAPAEILNGAMRYAQARGGEDKTYTAHPASWLRAKRWGDEPEPPRGGNGSSNGKTKLDESFDRVRQKMGIATEEMDYDGQTIDAAEWHEADEH